MIELLNSKDTLLLNSPRPHRSAHTQKKRRSHANNLESWQLSLLPCRSPKVPNEWVISWVVWNLIDSVFSYIYVHFHLKGALYRFSLAYPECPRHSSCALGLFLSKTTVIWTQAPQRCWDRWSGNQEDYSVTNGQEANSPGYVGRWDVACSRWDGAGRHGIPSCYTKCTQNGVRFKTCELLCSGILY